jgi:hypothetical protein
MSASPCHSAVPPLGTVVVVVGAVVDVVVVGSVVLVVDVDVVLVGAEVVVVLVHPRRG